MKINIIVAFSKNLGIGINNNLPWKLSSDLKKFRALTIGEGNNAVIMGKNTWLSLPVKYLKERDNLILSKTIKIDITHSEKKNLSDNNYIVKTFEDINLMLQHCKSKKYDIVWIIGGENIYREFMSNTDINIDEIHVTYIDKEYTCDTFFPSIDFDKYSSVIQKEHLNSDETIDFKIFDRIYKKTYLS